MLRTSAVLGCMGVLMVLGLAVICGGCGSSSATVGSTAVHHTMTADLSRRISLLRHEREMLTAKLEAQQETLSKLQQKYGSVNVEELWRERVAAADQLQNEITRRRQVTHQLRTEIGQLEGLSEPTPAQTQQLARARRELENHEKIQGALVQIHDAAQVDIHELNRGREQLRDLEQQLAVDRELYLDVRQRLDEIRVRRSLDQGK